jgi:glycosyltransferase involved in cell wall biosynthesis
MRIKIQQFLFGKLHSWASVGQNIGRALIKQGHTVEFISTDGINPLYHPNDLKPYTKLNPTGIYDCQISYTQPHNWQLFLSYGTKNRFAIWNYEYNNKGNIDIALLNGFAKYCKATDMVLPSSNFTKEVFLSMKIPENKMVVIPHGINIEEFSGNTKWPLRTKKSKKILLNIAQPHKRKAIPLALTSFGKAFTKDDDVCLVAKIFKSNKTEFVFNIDFNSIYKTWENKFPKHAEVELIFDYIPNISDIYKSCDINFSATHAECWHLPSLEALACNLINVVPNYGGQLDFCNKNNSLLIDGKIVRAPKDHQYLSSNNFAVHFEIDTNDCAKKLQQAVNNTNSLVKTFSPNMNSTVSKFTWDNVASSIISICT